MRDPIEYSLASYLLLLASKKTLCLCVFVFNKITPSLLFFLHFAVAKVTAGVIDVVLGGEIPLAVAADGTEVEGRQS